MRPRRVAELGRRALLQMQSTHVELIVVEGDQAELPSGYPAGGGGGRPGRTRRDLMQRLAEGTLQVSDAPLVRAVELTVSSARGGPCAHGGGEGSSAWAARSNSAAARRVGEHDAVQEDPDPPRAREDVHPGVGVPRMGVRHEFLATRLHQVPPEDAQSRGAPRSGESLAASFS